MPGRSFSSDSYRYGFNGMEKDDEIKGSGNSLDFGARIYDSRLGRWMSVDPLQAKYPSLSPYHAFADNPILVVDKDGKENIIYIVVLGSAEGALKNVDYSTLAGNASKRLSDMGLKTEVRVYDPSINGEFNALNLDNTDSYALIGSVDEIKSFVSESDGSAKEGFEGGHFASLGWNGGRYNPEESAIGIYDSYVNKDKLGQGILVDANGITGFSEEGLGVSLMEGLELTILHGGHHNANGGGHEGPGLQRDAESVSGVTKKHGVGPVYEEQKNDNTAPWKQNFGTNKAVDNYGSNKRTKK
jgi:RHS repeat-associated protein